MTEDELNAIHDRLLHWREGPLGNDDEIGPLLCEDMPALILEIRRLQGKEYTIGRHGRVIPKSSVDTDAGGRSSSRD